MWIKGDGVFVNIDKVSCITFDKYDNDCYKIVCKDASGCTITDLCFCASTRELNQKLMKLSDILDAAFLP